MEVGAWVLFLAGFLSLGAGSVELSVHRYLVSPGDPMALQPEGPHLVLPVEDPIIGGGRTKVTFGESTRRSGELSVFPQTFSIELKTMPNGVTKINQ